MLTREMAVYADAAQHDSELYRFRYSVSRAIETAERLQRTEHMTTLYAAADGFEPARAAFITQDEIDKLLSGGSNIERGKQRIYNFYNESHTQKERIEFLKNEYGIGGSGRIGYDESHDGKGIAFARSDANGRYDKVILSWSQVDHQIGTLIRQNRYLSAEEVAALESSRTDTVTLVSEPTAPEQNVFQSNTPSEPPAPEPDVFQSNTQPAAEPDYQIIGRADSAGQLEVAMPQMDRLLEQGIVPDAVMCLNDPSALGEMAALQEHGLLEKTTVYGVDGAPEAKSMISEGAMTATAAQSPIRLGQITAQTVYAILNGEDYEKEITVPVELVTKDNVNGYDMDGWQ